MITASSFKNRTLRIIDLFSEDLYVVHPDERINCICIDATSKNADPACPICLGTGHKIYIRKVRGSHQNTDLPDTAESQTSRDMTSARDYYIKSKYMIYQDDIIVDDKAYFVLNSKPEKAFSGEVLYTKNTTFIKKFNQELFLKNFKKIIGE